uniref:restriction endonuclease subunit S n=1 Tax=Segatella hominis TaxID=2518605 RepID=UPI00402880B1
MNGKQLKNSILQWAIQGKLVTQDPHDEPASVLLDKIRQEKERLIKEKKIKRDKNASIIYRGEDNSYYEKMLATGEVKCIDEEIPFEIPATWNWARLSNITSILGDGIHGTPEYDATGTVYFINGNNLSNGSIEIKTDTKKVSEQEAEKHKRLLNSTTVLVSINGTLGNVAFYNGENVILGKSACYFNLMGNIDKQYIKHILETEYFTEYAKNVATGSTIKNVPLAGMRNFLIPVPPITEQHRIILGMVRLAHSIVRYNDAQTKLDLLNNALNEKLKKSVLQEAIQGKLVPQLAEEGTAQELLEQIKAEKEKLVKEGKLKKSALNNSVIFRGDDNKYYTINKKEKICIDDEIPFDIPDTWEWCRLGTLFSHCTGKALNASNLKGQLMTYITTSNLYWDRFELGNIKQMRFTDEEIEKCTATFGDLLVCEGGDVGRAAIWNYPYDIRIQNHIHKLRAYKQLCTKFFFWVFYFYKAIGRIGGKGIGIQGLSSKALDNILIPLPPLKEQQRIVAQIEKLFEQLH